MSMPPFSLRRSPLLKMAEDPNSEVAALLAAAAKAREEADRLSQVSTAETSTIKNATVLSDQFSLRCVPE